MNEHTRFDSLDSSLVSVVVRQAVRKLLTHVVVAPLQELLVFLEFSLGKCRCCWQLVNDSSRIGGRGERRGEGRGRGERGEGRGERGEG